MSYKRKEILTLNFTTMFTLIIGSAFKGTKKQFAAALIIAAGLDSLIILPLI